MTGDIAMTHRLCFGMPHRRAFSLVEILIAVLVLALGLLGLGAVFPVVLLQQRAAADAAVGVSIADSAWASIEGHPGLNYVDNPFTAGDERGFEVWQDNLNWSRNGEWVVPQATGGVGILVDAGTGLLSINGPGGSVDIPVSQRLIPAPYTPGTEPRYVWDFVGRRVRTTLDESGQAIPTAGDAIELAVFIRRIDSNIRVPARERRDRNAWVTLGKTLRLSDVIVQNPDELSTSEFRVPVGVQETGAQELRPTNDGTGIYALPFVVMPLDVEYAKLKRDRIPIDTNSVDPARLSLITKVGQKLVDEWGTIYTVTGVDKSQGAGNPRLIVDPAVDGRFESAAQLGSLAMVPQPPVAVRVMRITP